MSEKPDVSLTIDNFDLEKCLLPPSKGGYKVAQIKDLANSLGIMTKNQIKANLCHEIKDLISVESSNIDIISHGNELQSLT